MSENLLSILVTLIGFGGTALTVWGTTAKKNQETNNKIDNSNLAMNNKIDNLLNVLEDFRKEVAELRDGLKEVQRQLDELRTESRKADEIQKRATMNHAKDRINQAHRYFTKLGKIDEPSLQSILAVWESYKECGGNTFIDLEIEEIKALPRVTSLIIEQSKNESEVNLNGRNLGSSS